LGDHARPSTPQTGELTIRRAMAGDAAVMTRIAFAAKRHWGYPEAWIQLWRDELTVDPAYPERAIAFLAERCGETVGWCGFSESSGVWEIDHFWVAPAAMGAGVGSRLLRHGVNFLVSRGVGALRILSDPHAVGFYKKFGAMQIGEEPGRPEGRMLPVLTLRLAQVSTR